MFLFNDLLVVTKLLHRGRYRDSYTFRHSFPLAGIKVQLYSNVYHEFGLRLTHGNTVLLNLNGRNEFERLEFVKELKEFIIETEETERILALVHESRKSGIETQALLNSMIRCGEPGKEYQAYSGVIPYI